MCYLGSAISKLIWCKQFLPTVINNSWCPAPVLLLSVNFITLSESIELNLIGCTFSRLFGNNTSGSELWLDGYFCFNKFVSNAHFFYPLKRDRERVNWERIGYMLQCFRKNNGRISFFMLSVSRLIALRTLPLLILQLNFFYISLIVDAYWWLLDISEWFQLLLVTPIVLQTPKAPSFYPVHLNDPLILIFVQAFQVVDLALPLSSYLLDKYFRHEIQRSIFLGHVWDLYKCFFWFETFFDLDRGPSLCKKFGHNNHIYVNFHLHFSWHKALPETLYNYSAVNLNRYILYASSISCRKLLNFVKTITLLKENVHYLP